MTNNPLHHLVSISAHVDYNWQTIKYTSVIVIIIIIIEYIDLLNAQSINDAQTNFAQQVKMVHLLFNTSKFYKTVVVLRCFCPTYTYLSLLILHFCSNKYFKRKQQRQKKKNKNNNNNKTKIKRNDSFFWFYFAYATQ